jgi:hypothetical protein
MSSWSRKDKKQCFNLIIPREIQFKEILNLAIKSRVPEVVENSLAFLSIFFCVDNVDVARRQNVFYE